MIWVRGEIVTDNALTISVLDRTFEHGLGLFETLRTWNCRATLLPRHLDRLKKAAHELDLALDPGSLPDASAVTSLLKANNHEGDAMLRITMSGGSAEENSAVLWMRAFPLPPDADPTGWTADAGYWDVAMSNPLARYKTMNYWERRLASELASVRGVDETLSQSPPGSPMEGTLWEGSRTNLFIGIGDRLLTPPVGDEEPIVPGIMRGLVLEHAERLEIRAIEVPITEDILERATEVFLTNSVRGIIPLKQVASRSIDQVPGPLSQKLWAEIHSWLTSEHAESSPS